MMTDNWDKLASVFNTVFGLDQIDETVSVVSFEPWDSMAHITLVLELEKEFGTQFSTDEAVEMTSVPEILTVLDHRART